MKPKQVRRTLERLGNETVLPATKEPEDLNNGADTENTAPNQQEIA